MARVTRAASTAAGFSRAPAIVSAKDTCRAPIRATPAMAVISSSGTAASKATTVPLIMPKIR